MSSEKPFWEGKTCEEMAGLHIKVTFKNGDVATGVADKNGDIKSVYVLTLGMGDDLFVPQADIESIELLDDPNYERIEEADDLQEKDIAVMLDGNRYKVTDVEKAVTDSGVGYTALSGRNVSPLASTPSPTDSVRSPGFLTSLDCGWTRTITHG